MLSMLAGHKRYSHFAALRGDGVLPELLGMRKIVSEDLVRRAFAAIEEEAGAAWMRRHLDHCLEPLLSQRWILDIDTTVKPLYGRQEGAVVGYNPKKPGRPSHCYHTYSMAGTRLVFDVDVCAGDEHASNHAAPALWALLDRTARDCWPTLLRGDKGFGAEKIMREAELRALAYLFNLRLTANVRRAIERLSQQSEWVDLGQGWQAKETQVRLKGWSRQRRIIVLRRRVKGELATPSTDDAGQRRLTFVDILPSEELWEYQVLATSLVEQLGSFGQLYRDRADGENIFDELKNQWGWGGFVTQDPRAVAWRRAWSRCFMIGGTSLFVWPSLIGTEKPSQAVPCCCTPSQSGCAMRDKPLSESPACTPARFPPPRRFGPSPSSFVAWLKLRSSWRRCIDGGKSSREPSRPSSKAVPCALLRV